MVFPLHILQFASSAIFLGDQQNEHELSIFIRLVCLHRTYVCVFTKLVHIHVFNDQFNPYLRHCASVSPLGHAFSVSHLTLSFKRWRIKTYFFFSIESKLTFLQHKFRRVYDLAIFLFRISDD